MPTKKPRIQTILEVKYYEKYCYLCKLDNRTESNMGKMIIEKYIDEYERKNGKIPTHEYPLEIPYTKKDNKRGK